jgi:hypothetical protein
VIGVVVEAALGLCDAQPAQRSRNALTEAAAETTDE